ncbi:MAG: hypothetical protein H6757_01810 [Candidatus Omnitrophica bacterium]|nr:hypothetical protein [Candidatus Omnitrophota bacterium]
MEKFFSYGVIARIKADKIYIREFDDESGKDVENAYRIHPRILLKSFKSNDDVEFDYICKDNDKIVVRLEKDQGLQFDDETDDQEGSSYSKDDYLSEY